MSLIDLAALERTPLATDPFEHVIVPDFVPGEALKRVIADYPAVPGPGSYPLDTVKSSGAFQALVDELNGPTFRADIEKLFNVDLSDRPTMFTVRGFCQKKDGDIHTDSKTKIITILLYLNEQWEEARGRLRLLRDGENLDNYVHEVPPYGGTLLAFKRSDNSWHGHERFEGPRRALQMNWVTDQKVVEHEQRRHKLSAFGKSLFGKKAM